jgi:hypothetical protein
MAVGINGAAAGLARGWLDTLSNTSYAAGATPYVQLHTADPGVAGTTAVCATVPRQSLTWAAASTSGNTTTKAISNAPQWAAWNGVNGEIVTHISVWTAITAGTFLFSAPLAQSRTINTGDTVNLTSLSISITPVAV